MIENDSEVNGIDISTLKLQSPVIIYKNTNLLEMLNIFKSNRSEVALIANLEANPLSEKKTITVKIYFVH